MSTTNCPFPWALAIYTSTRIKSRAAAAADLQHLLKELWVESRKMRPFLSAPGKPVGQVFRSFDISGADFMSPILVSPLEKH